MSENSYTRRMELDYINAIACLLVILIHVLSYGIANADPLSWQARIIYFPWRLSGFVVPVFLFTGAIKMALFFKSTEITAKVYLRYMWERSRNIYFPYTVWVVIYYLCFYAAGYLEGSLSELIISIFWGNLSGQFYYIVIVMQFYLLMPLWMRAVRKIPFFAALCVSVFIMMVALRSANIFSQIGVRFSYFDRLFPSYILFWILGIYAGARYDQIVKYIKQIGTGMGAVFCLCIFAGILFSYIHYSMRISLLDLDYLKIITDIMSIVLIWTMCVRIKGNMVHVERWLSKIGKASYQVYLSHCLFLTVGTAVLEGYGFHLTEIILLRLTIGYAVPFLLYFGWRKGINGIRRCIIDRLGI